MEIPEKGIPLEIGKARIINRGSGVAILSFGARLSEAQKARENLTAKGINPTIVDARFAKPLDHKLILELAEDHESLITIEEGAVGGFGSHVAQFLSDNGCFDSGLKFRMMCFPDEFIDHGSPSEMYAAAKLNAIDIEEKVLSLLDIDILKANKN